MIRIMPIRASGFSLYPLTPSRGLPHSSHADVCDSVWIIEFQLRPRLRELHTAVMRRRVSTWAVSVTGTAAAAPALLRTSGAASSCSSWAEVLTFITSVCSSNSLGAHPMHPPQLYSTFL